MSNPTASQYYLGLISGTSADGIDAALVRFDGGDASPLQAELIAARTLPWQPGVRARLVWLGQGGALDSLDELGELDAQVGEAFADAALAILGEAGVAHGDPGPGLPGLDRIGGQPPADRMT